MLKRITDSVAFKIADIVTTVVLIVLIAVSLLSGGCSFNQTIANQKNYEVVASADNGSANLIEIPVTAEVTSKDTSTQDTSAEQSTTPDAVSSLTGTVGKLLVP